MGHDRGSGWFDRHRARLDGAVEAAALRTHFSVFDEPAAPPDAESAGSPPADPMAAGRRAFEAWLGTTFPIATPGAEGTIAPERSPYGYDLRVAYPRVVDVDALVAAAGRRRRPWRDAGPDARVGVCLEILDRLDARAFELAHALQHTCGMPIGLAYAAGVTNALDRSLETLAWSWSVMTSVAGSARWERPGWTPMDKTYTVIPRGLSLLIGCDTFPTWSDWPALFASLAAGNPVIVHPHPRTVLPFAITVQVCQEVLAEAGFDPTLVTLAVAEPGDPLRQSLAVRPEVAIVDYTGNADFCQWLERRAGQARLFTETPGVNCVVIDSTPDFEAMCDNLALSLAIFSGQMITAPHNILVPRGGIETDEGTKTPAEVAAGIGAALDRLLADERQAVELIGVLAGEEAGASVDQAMARPSLGSVLVPSRPLKHPDHPGAVLRTPLVLGRSSVDAEIYPGDTLGPVTFLIETADTEESIALLYLTADRHGAVAASVYSTSEDVVAEVRSVALDHGIMLSENLHAEVVLNAAWAFSDFHGGGSPSGASYVDASYVSPRFRMVQSRRHA
ncbi:phenylacetic acid degradation protein PaaN [Nocardioides mangrovi]|uniref:Phenylacetic acid degradation protein PaaN n=1 Tax=Nocardioides mangrovi TaxID=2874580 RepID=A0ABS7UBA3_9ACTN|nr:phenylacetic acid degradation protein PaaN [Nocardioides mangrovi]MBZ5737968.1 phenylacetic acid degradation protein PaaN [Nocardioides mangrovi]